MTTSLIDRIYEASVVSARWPDLLQDIARQAGARGATIVTRAPDRFDLIVSPAMQQDAEDFIAQGWGDDTDYTAPLFDDLWPGFRREADYRTPAEIAALPVHRDFMHPRGYLAGAGTVIQGTGDHAVHVATEGFPSHEAAGQAIPFLDGLRPHLARSISLTALRIDQSQVVVDSLALTNAAAAVVSGSGRLRSANDLFLARMGNRMAEGPRGLRFADSGLTARVTAALERHRHGKGRVQSVAIRDADPAPPFAIHLLPILGAAKQVCGSDGVLLLIADSANASIPSADLLRVLFDLTAGEARVARLIASGQSVTAAAQTLRIGEGTVRAHLKAVFAKVGGNRQADLVRLLSGLGAPASRSEDG